MERKSFKFEIPPEEAYGPFQNLNDKELLILSKVERVLDRLEGFKVDLTAHSRHLDMPYFLIEKEDELIATIMIHFRSNDEIVFCPRGHWKENNLFIIEMDEIEERIRDLIDD